jgi:hypothetical protein
MSMKVSDLECLVENQSNSRMEHADGLSGEVSSSVPRELTLTKGAENVGYLWQIFKTAD